MMDRYVSEALQKAVISAVAASDDATLPVKMMGRTLSPPSNDKWLEVIQIPNDDDTTWGDEKLYQGMLRLILHWPVDDKGVYDPMDLIKSIVDYFQKGSKHSDTGSNVSVSVTRHPRFLGVIEDAPETLYPYSIRYRYYKT